MLVPGALESSELRLVEGLQVDAPHLRAQHGLVWNDVEDVLTGAVRDLAFEIHVRPPGFTSPARVVGLKFGRSGAENKGGCCRILDKPHAGRP